MSSVRRWILGLIYIFAVATIWIAASFVVQSVVDSGVSPFLITYICNSLFVIYIPIVEISRFLENSWLWHGNKSNKHLQRLEDSEEVVLLGGNDLSTKQDYLNPSEPMELRETTLLEKSTMSEPGLELYESERMPFQASGPDSSGTVKVAQDANKQLDVRGRWTRTRVAKVSLLICPFWFLAQLCFNLSLKFTTVTSNTILSSSSSLFTFVVSLLFLGEKFTWVKLISVLLCMGGTIIVSLGDSKMGLSAVATNPLLGDTLALVSAGFYAIYITLIRKMMPDDDDNGDHVSMAEFLGFVGLFNLIIFLPVALVLNFTKLEPFHALTWNQFGLIVGKGLLDNVISDYLWAKAVLLTTTTVATAGLSIQVPLAALIDTLKGNAPRPMDYLGAAAVMVGFAGINIPSDACSSTKDVFLEEDNAKMPDHNQSLSISKDAVAIS
ncbi:PREDICTED: solute carrier family 35 member F5-like isoform X1 [Nelumbo nucifera]|uniref:Solute carrier family 35 member F5-like isoform X1 n=1 Tax=Nelumbo nucifera TaxID=4432 RepID=A0A1U8B601_NELNU|nr:PREDICTED: solute carrier family 35 member F5-like isoform X1 [Nelumbo nucifera]XP_010274908.1 PREDICTED: solute carrier family 35 member F5-like isoform X1 [Nelumbo nucifera]